MRTALNQLRWMAAGSLLLVGGAWAGTIYRSAPAYRGPDPAQLAALAGRLESTPVATVELLPNPPTSTSPRRLTAPAPLPVRAAVTPRVATPPVSAPVLPPVTTTSTTSTPAPPPAPAKPAESPVKSLALMGLTHRGQEDTAWLVDLNNLTRETAEVGDRAFGFTVKEIGAETVLLARNGEEYELRLGEKSIPVPVDSQPVASVEGGFGAAGDFGNGMGRRGRGQGRQGGGFSGFGGQSRGSFRAQSGGGRGSRFSSSGSAPSLGGGSSSFGGGNNRGNRFSATTSGNRGGTSFGGNRGGASFSGMMGGRGNFGGSSNMTSQFAAGTTGGSTSNPQTARRRGSRLTGDTPAQAAPVTISNPQTQRRVGTTSGAAFGQTSTTGRNATARR